MRAHGGRLPLTHVIEVNAICELINDALGLAPGINRPLPVPRGSGGVALLHGNQALLQLSVIEKIHLAQKGAPRVHVVSSINPGVAHHVALKVCPHSARINGGQQRGSQGGRHFPTVRFGHYVERSALKGGLVREEVSQQGNQIICDCAIGLWELSGGVLNIGVPSPHGVVHEKKVYGRVQPVCGPVPQVPVQGTKLREVSVPGRTGSRTPLEPHN